MRLISNIVNMEHRNDSEAIEKATHLQIPISVGVMTRATMLFINYMKGMLMFMVLNYSCRNKNRPHIQCRNVTLWAPSLPSVQHKKEVPRSGPLDLKNYFHIILYHSFR